MHYFALSQRGVHPKNAFTDDSHFEVYTEFQKLRASLKQGECLTFAMGVSTPKWVYTFYTQTAKTSIYWAFSDLGGVHLTVCYKEIMQNIALLFPGGYREA